MSSGVILGLLVSAQSLATNDKCLVDVWFSKGLIQHSTCDARLQTLSIIPINSEIGDEQTLSIPTMGMVHVSFTFGGDHQFYLEFEIRTRVDSLRNSYVQDLCQGPS